ncbi:hypothetical protein R3P38DRAFT_2816714 [Favolaschia claudopus]|uniref:Uncharacterized protein n=1 Tax=Favolaschia claudopus TaxID=2862362 RepID=A0AAV9YYG4_9AGAR
MVLTWSNTAIEAVRNAQGNAKARMLSFGKETVDQAIQQGNARVSNGNQQDIGELAAHSCPLERNGQQHIKKYDSRQSTQAAYFDFYKTTPHQANLYHRKDIRLSSYKEQRCLIVHTSTGLQGLRLSLRPSTDRSQQRHICRSVIGHSNRNHDIFGSWALMTMVGIWHRIPIDLAILPGNWAPNSMQRVPKRGEFGATTTAWEGIGGNAEKTPPESRE